MTNIEILLGNYATIRKVFARRSVTSASWSFTGRALILCPTFPGRWEPSNIEYLATSLETAGLRGITPEGTNHLHIPVLDGRARRGIKLAYEICRHFRRFFHFDSTIDEHGVVGRYLTEAEREERARDLRYESIQLDDSWPRIIIDGLVSSTADHIIGNALDAVLRDGTDEERADLLGLVQASERRLPVPDESARRSELAAELARVARPRFVMVAHLQPTPPKDSRFESHFHGQPYFEEGESWPVSDDGRPIPFVLQLVDGGSGALLPGVGVLQLFSDWSGLDGPRYRVRTYATVDRARAAIVVPPRELEPKRVSTIELVADGSLPEWGEIVYPQQGSRDERVVAACKALDADVPEAAFEEAAVSLVRHPDAWSYVGGYPRSVQSSPGSPGDDFVLQVGSDAHLGLRWDDNGAVYVFWRREAQQFAVLIQAT